MQSLSFHRKLPNDLVPETHSEGENDHESIYTTSLNDPAASIVQSKKNEWKKEKKKTKTNKKDEFHFDWWESNSRKEWQRENKVSK